MWPTLPLQALVGLTIALLPAWLAPPVPRARRMRAVTHAPGVAPATMRRRVEETLDMLGLADVRDRPLLSLSAGQRQRVAIGSVLTVHPRVLVLDEPTSALDPAAAEEVLAALTRLVHDLGVTVVLAEHPPDRAGADGARPAV